MVNACAAYNCTYRYKKGDNVKFHRGRLSGRYYYRFPKDELLRKNWIIALNRHNYEPSTTAVICSKHFTENDYYSNVFGNKILKRTAVPSIFDYPQKMRVEEELPELPTQCPIQSQPMIINRNIMEKYTPHPVLVDLPKNNLINGRRKRKSPVHINDFSEDDLDSPRKRHKYWTASQDAMAKYRKSNSCLRGQLYRYMQKVSNLNNLIDDLRQKNEMSHQSTFMLKECLNQP